MRDGINMKRIRLHCLDQTIIEIQKQYLGDNSNIKVDYFDDGSDNYYTPTLRDICIILYEMMGQGVTWQLADEIAKNFHLNPYELERFLADMCYEYSKMDEEKADRLETEAWNRNEHKSDI